MVAVKSFIHRYLPLLQARSSRNDRRNVIYVSVPCSRVPVHDTLVLVLFPWVSKKGQAIRMHFVWNPWREHKLAGIPLLKNLRNFGALRESLWVQVVYHPHEIISMTLMGIADYPLIIKQRFCRTIRTYSWCSWFCSFGLHAFPWKTSFLEQICRFSSLKGIFPPFLNSTLSWPKVLSFPGGKNNPRTWLLSSFHNQIFARLQAQRGR